jgi:hypothetical protein
MEEEGGRVRPSSIWAKARFGEGVVIGNLDTGNTLTSSCSWSLQFFRCTCASHWPRCWRLEPLN